ncbi:TIGR02186 family protein [Yoonia sp. F2084L]|uniref:TIGR02186 family protein n=1 Tax=Yoonia sp. F2084L TaxID=2926419 RepID=UPI001FF16265|nr:TIGR02186 family protein [Yoonia sp. F2084L]MCK0095142.1 TIGR02186 family protein [Yoonia sp. F2084L]
MIRFVALFLMLALPAKAEEIVLGLSRDEVAITATFEGSEILIFGAIKREAPIQADGDLGVIVTVAGPDEPVTVRKKDRRFGIWVNTESVEVDVAPTFYAVATNRPLNEILTATEDLNTRISTSRAIRSVGATVSGAERFTQALIRIRAGQGLYQTLPEGVWVEEESLFRTLIPLPANLTEGDYKVEIYLTRDRQIVDLYATTIPVKKVGLERWLYNLAHENPFLYGLMSLSIAIAAGWGASAAFSVFRR